MTNKQYEFVKAVAAGKNAVDAYAEAYECDREHAQKHARAALRAPDVERELEKFREADRAEAKTLRMEVLSTLLQVMRDEEMPPASRLAACKQIAEIAGITKQQVEISADDSFRAALLSGCKEGFVKK